MLTQPAVSRQIGGLERQFGVAARGVTPTTAGTTAVEQARGVLARLDALDATMRTLAGLDAGHSACAPSPAPTRCSCPDLALLTAWQLYADPATARIDPDATPLPASALRDTELVPLLDEQLHVALPDSHPLAEHETIDLADLRDETWIEGAYPDCLGPLPQMTDALGAPPRIGFTCHDWNGKQALVASGAGLMLVPTLARAAMRPNIRLRRTNPTLPTRRLCAALPNPPFRTPPATAFLDLLTTLLPAISSAA